MQSPPYLDTIWFWVYCNKIQIYSIFYLLKGDYKVIDSGFGFWGSGFEMVEKGFGVSGLGCGVEDFRVWDLLCLGFRGGVRIIGSLLGLVGGQIKGTMENETGAVLFQFEGG